MYCKININFLKQNNNMKNVFLLILIIVGVYFLTSAIENRDNLQSGKESVDITWIKQISVASVNYLDTILAPTINSGVKGFKIKNITTSIQYVKAKTLKTTTAIIWPLTPGWNPENFTEIDTSYRNTTTTIYIGK